MENAWRTEFTMNISGLHDNYLQFHLREYGNIIVEILPVIHIYIIVIFLYLLLCNRNIDVWRHPDIYGIHLLVDFSADSQEHIKFTKKGTQYIFYCKVECKYILKIARLSYFLWSRNMHDIM
jgi:hypothetical protein